MKNSSRMGRWLGMGVIPHLCLKNHQAVSFTYIYVNLFLARAFITVINGEMRGYQLQGLNWMVSLNRILADEMVHTSLARLFNA